MTTRRVPAGVEFAVRCLLIGVLGWLGASAYLAFTWAEEYLPADTLFASYVRTVPLLVVSFLVVAVMARLLIRALGGWRHGVRRWQFAFFAAIVSVLAYTLYGVVSVAYDAAEYGPSSLLPLLGSTVMVSGVMVLAMLHPLWFFLAALLVGPGGSARRSARDPEPAPVTVTEG